MRPTALVTLALPIGMAACADAPTAAREAHPTELAADVVPASTVLLLAQERIDALNASLADAQLRLVPAVTGNDVGVAGSLPVALQRLADGIAASDAAAILAAAADAESALATIPADRAEPILPDIDAVRLTLDEARLAAAELTGSTQQ
ncbi:MAG TPA: hypothetical protein VF092_25875 [Longimicrobium sp.]